MLLHGILLWVNRMGVLSAIKAAKIAKAAESEIKRRATGAFLQNYNHQYAWATEAGNHIFDTVAARSKKENLSQADDFGLSLLYMLQQAQADENPVSVKGFQRILIEVLPYLEPELSIKVASEIKHHLIATQLVAEAEIEKAEDERRKAEAFAKASAKGNENYAKALYFDERIKRLEDAWQTEQKRLLDNADFKLAEHLASLSKDMDIVNDQIKSFKKQSVTVMGLLCVVTLALFAFEQIQLALFTLLLILLVFTFFVIKETSLDREKRRINEKIESIDKANNTAQPASKFLIIVALAISAWIVFKYVL